MWDLLKVLVRAILVFADNGGDMKGFGLLLVLIALAVGGYLVVKEYQPGSAGGASKINSIKRAGDAAEQARQATQKMDKAVQQATGGSQ